MLEAKHIAVTTSKGHSLLREVSLQLRPGEILAVLGPNGAGKSTLLKALSGHTPISAGEIQIHGKNMAQWPAQELARVRAVLSQSVHMGFPFSVLDTVELGRYAYAQRESRHQGRAIAQWALGQVGMQAFAGRDISSLSGGEQQRVHLARLLAQLYEEQAAIAKFVLLDEPLSSLDIAQQYNMLALFRQWVEAHNMGGLIILHDMNLAVQFADRVILLRGGSLYAQGSPEEVFTVENIREVYQVEAMIQENQALNCIQILMKGPGQRQEDREAQPLQRSFV